MALQIQKSELRCRVCLSNNSNMISLQEAAIVDGVSVLLSEILYNCASIQLAAHDDRMPQHICVTCSVNAHISYKFKQDCERSDEVLQNELKEMNSITVKIEHNDLSTNLDIEEEDEDCEDPLDPTDMLSQSELEVDEKNIIHSDHSNNSDIESSSDPSGHNNHILAESIPIDDRTCTDCGNVYKHRTSMLKHKKTHGACKYCDFVPERPSKLFKHMEEEHAIHKTFICSVCGKSFFSKKNLNSHMTMHSGVKNHTCEICGLSFALSGNLKSHKRLHTGDKPYACTECGKSFAQSAALYSHQASHSSERNYVCPDCGATFSRAGAMTNHRKRHTGNRPFLCLMAMCNKSFTSNSERKRHMAIHTGIKNFECEVCGKRFNRNTNLTVHARIHTGETPHTCHVCGKGFIQAHCLRTHLNTHTDALPK